MATNEVSVPLYYTYNQNNSGGWFMYDDRVCNYVIVQAISPADADRRAEAIGIYFDGVDDDRDCECCGDRWYRLRTGAGLRSPRSTAKTRVSTRTCGRPGAG